MNDRNGPGTNGARYLQYVSVVAASPSFLRAVDIPRLFDGANMPPSIEMHKRDFLLWLLDETLLPRTRAALLAMKETI